MVQITAYKRGQERTVRRPTLEQCLALAASTGYYYYKNENGEKYKLLPDGKWGLVDKGIKQKSLKQVLFESLNPLNQ